MPPWSWKADPAMEKTFDLETLLPHRAPMILLDAVIGYDESFACARVRINWQSAFFDPVLDGVPAWVGMEYMAQAIGIWAGHQQLSRGLPVQVGFLLGSRQYRCNVPVFAPGQELRVTARPVYCDDSGLGAFDCRIEGDGILASAQIKAFRPEDPQAFIRQLT